MNTASFIYSVCAGIFGSLAAVSGKFAFGKYSIEQDPEFFSLFLFAFIIFNVLMWYSYSQSLARSLSTIPPMVVNTGINFINTGILGTVCFGETHALLWWFALVLVLSGVCLIASENQMDKNKTS